MGSRLINIGAKNNPIIRTTLRLVNLVKLLQVRWLGQFTDGLFQSALASFVLFSPERQPSASSAALAFSVVLLPYWLDHMQEFSSIDLVAGASCNTQMLFVREFYC